MARLAASRLKAGRIFIGETATNAAASFGGHKQSGNGREWGVFGLDAIWNIAGATSIFGYCA